MAPLVSSCIWMTNDELIIALDTHFGDPVDAYVNGSQVWLIDNGPGDVTLEWRLHPVAQYARPEALSTYDVFSSTALALAHGVTPVVAPEQLWDGLEAFVAFDESVEPWALGQAAYEALGIQPTAFGLVDHQQIGDRWEARQGGISVIRALLDQLTISD